MKCWNLEQAGWLHELDALNTRQVSKIINMEVSMSIRSFAVRLCQLTILLAIALPVFAVTPGPDITLSQETKMEFTGFLGRIMKMAGAGDPVVQTIYIKGNKKREDSYEKGKLSSSTIIDLDKEQIIFIDHNRKRYSVMSFAEMKAMMERTTESFADKQARRSEEESPNISTEFELTVDPTGKSKKIAGYKAEEYILKMRTKAVAESVDESEGGSGEMNIETTLWQSEEIQNLDEYEAFNRKMLEKMGGLSGRMGYGGFLDMLKRNNEELAEGFEQVQDEMKKLKGMTLASKSRFMFKGDASGRPGMDDNSVEIPSSLGGLMKGFGKGFGKKKKEDSGPKVLMETTTVTKKYSIAPIDASLFNIPAQYKQEEYRR